MVNKVFLSQPVYIVSGLIENFKTLQFLVEIPLANFSKVAKHTPPHNGDLWHLNLNRLGGKTNSQFSQWSPGKTKEPQFHAPEYFGRVIFSTRPVKQ